KQQSAVMALLYIAQSQNNNWIPLIAMKYIAKFLKIPYIQVYEVATFYSMYNLSPVGKNHIEVCTTSPCMLRGSDEILVKLKKLIGANIGEVSKDCVFSLNKVECLGACVNAPIVKINQNYYEDLNLQSVEELINKLRVNKKIKIGPQSSRKGSEPRKN
ncbi:MAG: NADH-quinone oxidoreductase subunit E, partial [Alphaproteobacteria bacterium]|nr:NADH-quinone oxidoreductase subunit E [Alphaproteobacteria bacterium]